MRTAEFQPNRPTMRPQRFCIWCFAIVVKVVVVLVGAAVVAMHTGSSCAGSSDVAKTFLSPITFKHLKVVVRT